MCFFFFVFCFLRYIWLPNYEPASVAACGAARIPRCTCVDKRMILFFFFLRRTISIGSTITSMIISNSSFAFGAVLLGIPRGYSSEEWITLGYIIFWKQRISGFTLQNYSRVQCEHVCSYFGDDDTEAPRFLTSLLKYRGNALCHWTALDGHGHGPPSPSSNLLLIVSMALLHHRTARDHYKFQDSR